jgi:GWxTD domain-containing protein
MHRFRLNGASRSARASLSVVAVLTSTLFCFQQSALCQKKQKLEKNYREWLERDVAYIITKDEKDALLRLTTNEARDKFIEDFWEVRNPNPGSPSNSYKDEIYQRIAFANGRFGIGSGVEGWRTDRGRTYITLGAPQQKQVFRNSANLYPIEIWFYSSPNPALPPFFYVMFYQREGSGDYRFYSPYTDGPDKLATGAEAINSRSAALKMIRDSAGPEVARVSLSLLPDEPVDETTGTVSLESDVLLNSIRNLANLPANRDEILRRKTLKENVSSRLLLEGRNLDIVTFPARDSRGLTRLDYAVRLHNPKDLSMTAEPDGRYSYAVEVRVVVFGKDNRPIFTQEKKLTNSITRARFDAVKDKVFGYEGILPLPPGNYHLDFQFTDWTQKASYHTAREVEVPVPPKEGVIVPSVLPFQTAEDVDPSLADVTPFAVGGVQFTPLVEKNPTFGPGTNLQVMYQIWAAAKDPRENLGKKLEVQYAFGRPAVPQSAREIKEEVAMDQFDAGGSLVTGKKLSLDQANGNYILTISVSSSEAKQSSFGTLSFKILDTLPAPEPWDVLEPEITQDAENGTLDEQRGLCDWSMGQVDEARVWFRRALQLAHSNEIARARLVDAYYSKKDYAAVISLYSDAGVTERTDPETLLRIATSLDRNGKTSEAISVLEKAVASHPEEGPLYLALAQYYREVGSVQKAAELTEKAHSLSVPPKTE